MGKELFTSKKGLFVLLGLMAMGVLVMMPLGCGGSSSSTGSATIPQVTGTIPADGATSVSTTVMAVINFSEPMDTLSVMDNLSGVSGTSGKTWINGDATLNVDFVPAPLDTNTTYTITIFRDAKDKEGDKLAAIVKFSFSTGANLATGSISGTISGDPQSDYDNSLGNTVVAVTGSDFLGTNDSTIIAAVQADSGGNFTVNHLENGTYYIVAVQETTGDEVDPDDGDSLGVYRDILAHASSAVPVTISANNVTGIDFTLHDPEAITGELTYAGADTGDMSGNAPDLYAFLGTIFSEGNTKLTTEGASSPDYYSYIGTTSPLWSYSLNPFVDSGISTTGIYPGLTQTGLTYIPPDSYHILAHIPTGVGDAVGFAPDLAVIADTGADAPGTDILLYDTASIFGQVEVSRIDTGSQPYQGATVTLLGWPLWSPVSDINGQIIYDDAPAGVPVAIHAEPDPADAASFYTSNTAYDIWSLSDFASARTVYIYLPSRNMVDYLAGLCGLTITSG